MDSKQLRKDYMKTLPHLNKALQHVQSQLSDLPPADFLLETNVKPYASVKRKMQKEEQSDPTQLSDLVRGRLFFSDQFNFRDLMGILKQLFGAQIQKFDKKSKNNEHGLEYHGIMHADLEIDGIKFELQLMPIEFKPYKDFLHEIYEKFRNEKEYDKLNDTQKEALKKIHNNLYKKLDNQAQTNRASHKL